MKSKEFIQLFVPPIYYKVKKQLFKQRRPVYHPLPKVDHEKNRMVVIGNGPSLNKTVELYEKQLLEADCLMVNFSARTSLFELIKPKYYVMTDQNWISDPENISEAIHLCVDALCAKTRWPMYIVMPATFRRWWALDFFCQNPNITILFDEAKWYKYPEEELFLAFAENRINPPTYTVLTYGVYLSLYWNYEETYLVGADTTFPTMIYVGQDDNLVYSVDSHFYKNNEVCPLPTDLKKKGRRFPANMEQYMEMCHNIFYEYNLLARYAKWKGLKVYNASEYSMIDCYERRKLN